GSRTGRGVPRGGAGPRLGLARLAGAAYRALARRDLHPNIAQLVALYEVVERDAGRLREPEGGQGAQAVEEDVGLLEREEAARAAVVAVAEREPVALHALGRRAPVRVEAERLRPHRGGVGVRRPHVHGHARAGGQGPALRELEVALEPPVQ